MPRLKSRKRYKKTRRTRKRYKKTGGGEELRAKAIRLRTEAERLREEATRLQTRKMNINDKLKRRLSNKSGPAPPPAPTNTQIQIAEQTATKAEQTATNVEKAAINAEKAAEKVAEQAATAAEEAATKAEKESHMHKFLLEGESKQAATKAEKELKQSPLTKFITDTEQNANIYPTINRPEKVDTNIEKKDKAYFLINGPIHIEDIKNYIEFIDKHNNNYFDGIVKILDKSYKTYIPSTTKNNNTLPNPLIINNNYFNPRLRNPLVIIPSVVNEIRKKNEDYVINYFKEPTIYTNKTYEITHVPNKIPYSIITRDIDTLIRSLLKILLLNSKNLPYVTNYRTTLKQFENLKRLCRIYISDLLTIIKPYGFVYNNYNLIFNEIENYKKKNYMPYIIEHGFRELYDIIVPPQNLKATS